VHPAKAARLVLHIRSLQHDPSQAVPVHQAPPTDHRRPRKEVPVIPHPVLPVQAAVTPAPRRAVAEAAIPAQVPDRAAAVVVTPAEVLREAAEAIQAEAVRVEAAEVPEVQAAQAVVDHRAEAGVNDKKVV